MEKPMISLGTETKWGKVEGVQSKDGERYYFIINALGTTSYLPADVVESEYAKQFTHEA